MRGEQNARLVLIKRYGQGLDSLIDDNFDDDGDDSQQSEFYDLLLDASSNLRSVTERSMVGLARKVEAADGEWDPDDTLTDILWEMMQRLKEAYQRLDERMPVYRQRGEQVYSVMVLAKHNVLKAFDAINNTRTTILEHDADVSGYSEAYENVDDLIAALNAED